MSLIRRSRSQGALPWRKDGSSAAVKDLESTIARFQAVLTDDDRKKLHNLKGDAHDSQSIITFTADLDRLDPQRRGKSVASRLASFLQTIEQFSPIVDAYTQSNPQIPALLWGSVKLTFTLLARFRSYFESFVDMVHGFGALYSPFAEYEPILPEPPRLGNAICAFHCAVVTCCERVVMAIRRPITSQILKALTQSFRSEIIIYVEDIRSKAEIVKENIRYAKDQAEHDETQKQRQETAENQSKLSVWIAKSNSELQTLKHQSKKQSNDTLNHRLLKDLSSYNYTSTFNSTRNKRHRYTCEWIFDADEFVDWYQSKRSNTVLHVTGKIGSGKSVLVSHLIERLCQKKQPDQFISFFFSRFDDEFSLTADTIIRSLLKQSLLSFPFGTLDPSSDSSLIDCLSKVKSGAFSIETLSFLYLEAIKLCKEWFIIIDGLDECDPSQQSALCQFFSDLIDSSDNPERIKVLFSGREKTTGVINHFFKSASRLFTGMNQTTADITAYAENIIDDKLSTRELVVGDPDLAGEILDAIKAKGEGMCLWVFLTIEDICSRKSDKDIRKALKDIPADLPATFNRVLGRIVQHRNEAITQRIFRWTAGTRRPLTLRQLREALSIEIGQKRLLKSSLINGIDRVTVWCENLVHVEETDHTVRFVHNSIREFLLKESTGNFDVFHFDKYDCETNVSHTCITYLNLDNFSMEVMDKSRDWEAPQSLEIPVDGSLNRAVQHTVHENISPRLGRLAKVLAGSTARSASVDSKRRSVPILASQRTTADHKIGALWYYAAENWFHHPADVSTDTNPKIWDLLGILLTNPRPSLALPWTESIWQSSAVESVVALNPDLGEDLSRILSKPGPGPVACLPFAAIYGHQVQNHSITIRAFRAMIEQQQGTQILYRTLSYLALQSIHENRGDSIWSHQFLDHDFLIEAVTECIASGSTGFSTLNVDSSDTTKYRNRSTWFHQDIGHTVSSKNESPSLVFARVTSDHSLMRLDYKSFCRRLNIQTYHLLGLRLASGSCIMDIAALYQGLTSRLMITFLKDCRHIAEISRKRCVSNADLRPIVLLTALTEKLYIALQKGDMQDVHNLLSWSQELGGLYPRHEKAIYTALSHAISYVWSPDLLSKIVRVCFGTSVGTMTIEREELFKQALFAKNWAFAERLANWEPLLKNSYHKSGELRLLVAAFCCDRCRCITTSVHMPRVRSTFSMCLAHTTQGNGIIMGTMPIFGGISNAENREENKRLANVISQLVTMASHK